MSPGAKLASFHAISIFCIVSDTEKIFRWKFKQFVRKCLGFLTSAHPGLHVPLASEIRSPAYILIIFQAKIIHENRHHEAYLNTYLNSTWKNISVIFFVLENIFLESSFTKKTGPKWSACVFSRGFCPRGYVSNLFVEDKAFLYSLISTFPYRNFTVF